MIVNACCRRAGANPPPLSSLRLRLCLCPLAPHQYLSSALWDGMIMPPRQDREQRRYRYRRCVTWSGLSECQQGQPFKMSRDLSVAVSRYHAGIPARQQHSTSGTWKTQGARTILSERPRGERKERERAHCSSVVYTRTSPLATGGVGALTNTVRAD